MDERQKLIEELLNYFKVNKHYQGDYIKQYMESVADFILELLKRKGQGK